MEKVSFSGKNWNLELIETLSCDHSDYLSWCVECFCSKEIEYFSNHFWEISQNVTFFIQYSRFHMSHFPTSQPTTALYQMLGCIQFSLQMLQMLTPVHNDTNDADDIDNADNADDYNKMVGIAQLKAFSCINTVIPLTSMQVLLLHRCINVMLFC